jgi:ATP-binding cassette subfamily F protein 3
VVAHDRHLLRATTDELWLVHEGRVAPFDGDLDDYRDWVLGLRRRATAARDDEPEKSRASVDRKTEKRREAHARQQRSDARKPYVTRQAVIEQELASLAAEKQALDAWLATPEAYVEDAKARLVESMERSGELTWSLARLESEWLEIAEALERLDARDSA